MAAALAGLFAAAFLAATLLPGSSEAVLAGLVAAERVPALPAVAVASIGNTLGSCVNWAIGRYLSRYRDHPRFPLPPHRYDRYAGWYRRWGVWSLLLSWAPVIGDPLTVVAGVARTPFALFVGLVALAKTARYLAVAGLVGLWG